MRPQHETITAYLSATEGRLFPAITLLMAGSTGLIVVWLRLCVPSRRYPGVGVSHLRMDELNGGYMQSLVGIFSSRAAAERTVRNLLDNHIPQESIIFLSSQTTETDIASVPTTDAEAAGTGKAIGAVVGGAAGVGAGLAAGSATASLSVPGVGMILAAGLGAAAALGIGGVVAGAKIGEEVEQSLDIGVPKDDVFFYRQLLKAGRSLVIINTDSQAKMARTILDQNGAEDVDKARKEWQKAA